jgi:hypothetical protein
LKEETKKLIELQEIDKQIMQLESRLEEIPNDIRAIEEDYRFFEESFINAEKSLKNIQVQKKDKDNDIQSIEEEIKKHQMELNNLKSNDAYSAVLKAIEICNEKKRAAEDEILAMMEKEEQLIAVRKDSEKKLKEKKDSSVRAIAELNSEIQRLKTLLEETNGLRAEATNNIEQGILYKYENLKRRKHGIAIVPLEEDSCGGCHVMFTAQQVSNVIRGNELVICNTCMRIVYFDEKKSE